MPCPPATPSVIGGVLLQGALGGGTDATDPTIPDGYVTPDMLSVAYALAADLDAETTARTNADSTEAAARGAAVSAEISARTAAISEEATNRANADNGLASSIATLASDLTGDQASLAAAIDDVQSNVDAEAARAETAEAANSTSIATTNTHLSTETSARAAAVATLTTNLATETTNRVNGDSTIAASVAAETTRAEAAESLLAPLASPTFTGTPAAPSAAADTTTTQVATTAFVIGQASTSTPLSDGSAAAGTSKRYARGDHVHPTDASRAPLASPTFTGTPAAPSPTVDDSTTRLATTAWVLGQTSSTNPVSDGTAAAGTSARFARSDHVHPSDSTKANLASPTFTGTPAAPTPSIDDSSTKLATTAWVEGQVSSSTPLMDGVGAAGSSTRFAKADHVHPTDTSRAPLASPTFTGTPSAPTPTPGDNSTLLATTSFVASAIIAGSDVGAETARAEAAEALALQISNNLSDVASASASRTNLGLGSAATHASTDFDAAGTAATVQTALTAEVSRAEAAEAASLQASASLSDVSNVTTARTNLGLGSAATHPTTDFDAAGAATAAVATETSRATTAEALKAPLASPALTGTPTAPTQTALNNSTRLATTAYTDGAVAVETSRATTAEATKASLASPAFTGTPTAPTQTAGNNSTRLATTAYADAATAVETARAGAAEALKAPIASPTFTGIVQSPALPINAQVGATYTLALTDPGKLITYNNAGVVTLTIPTHASVAIPVNSWIDQYCISTNGVIFAPAGGVTLQIVGGLTGFSQGVWCRLVQIATNSWIVLGLVSQAPGPLTPPVISG